MEAAYHLTADLYQQSNWKPPLGFNKIPVSTPNIIKSISSFQMQKAHFRGTYFFFDLAMMKYKSNETVSTAVPVSAIFGVLMVMLAQTKT